MKYRRPRHYNHTRWMAGGIKILALILLGWAMCASFTDPTTDTVTKEVKVPIIVPDPQFVTETVTVEKKQTKECSYLLRAVDDLSTATDALSATKADMTRMVSEIKSNIGTQEPNDGVQLRRDFWKVENEMNNAYIDIGTAQTRIAHYKGACD